MTNYTPILQQLMQQVDITSFKQLSRTAGVSERQLRRLRQGQVLQMRVETLSKLSQVLQVQVNKLLEMFAPELVTPEPDTPSEVLITLQQEYQHLQQELEKQRETLVQEFQQSSLQVLESWLVQWPTAAYAAQQNEQLPALKLLPLMRPVESLLQKWGVEAIAPVGAEVPYNPQYHQLISGNAQLGEMVRVRYTGYWHGDKLLYRAKVSPV
ncbi:MAG: helix-turn-helix domain-containing protein [Symploca sp. SIO2D2]|nr:helix-turn-helix domain-containing protein [Symploca sp. SIO2D2]